MSIINNTKQFSGILLLGSLIIGSFSLFFFSVRRFKQLHSEIAVMRNIGIATRKMIICHLFEYFFVTMIALLMAFFLTQYTTQPFADWQLAKQQQLANNSYLVFTINILDTSVNEITSIPVETTQEVYSIIIGVTVLFLFILFSVDFYQNSKFEPIDYLLERRAKK